jgi:PKD repeat protein
MKKAILVIALLALVSMMIAPVTGYDLVYSYSVAVVSDNNGVPTGLNQYSTHMMWNDTTQILSKVESTDMRGYRFDDTYPQSACYPIDYSYNYGSVIYGTGQLCYSFPTSDLGAANVSDGVTFSVTIDWDSVNKTSNDLLISVFGSAISNTIGQHMTFAGGTVYTPLGAPSDDRFVDLGMYLYTAGTMNIYSALPTPMVAAFSCIPTFANLTDDVICTDTSSGSPTSWSWNFDRPDLTNSGEASIYNTLGFEVTQIGHYIVEMTATNTAGSDTISYIIHGIYTGNQTVLNVTPVVTLAPFPTGISNPINVTNLRNSLLDNDAYGNLTQPYIDVVDLFVDYIFNAGSEIMSIFTAPFNWFSSTLASQTEDFETMIGPLISASSIFLQLIARALVSLPAAIINIVTLGLILDVFKIVLKGKGES